MHKPLAIALAAGVLAATAMLPAPSEAGPTHELNIGSIAPENTPWRDMLVQVEKHVESKTGGAINVINRPPGLMGEVEMVRETRKGERLQACAVTTAALAEGGNIPVLQLVELPFLFESYAEADAILDTVMWDDFSAVLKRRGFVLGVWSENGWRSFGTKAKPLRSPDELVGMKMRSQESDVHMATYKAFGANAVQKPMTEVLTSLQSNVIDGLDNTALYTLAAGLYEPLDYFTLTRHVYQPAAVAYSRRWFDTLPENYQQILMEPKDLFTASGRKAIRAEEQNMLALFPEMGMKVVELSDDELKAFRTKGRAMHAGFAATIEGGPETYAKIDAALKKMR